MTTTKIRSFQPNGYQDTIKKGLSTTLVTGTNGTKSFVNPIKNLPSFA